MSSTKLILLFIGIILLIVVILSSNRIGLFLRNNFGKFLPATFNQSGKISPTPSIKPSASPTPSPTSSKVTSNTSNNPVTYNSTKGTTSSEIPATGPESIVYVLLSGSFLTGLAFKKLSNARKI